MEKRKRKHAFETKTIKDIETISTITAAVQTE